MQKPIECQREFPIRLSNDVYSTTTKVWEILSATYLGNISPVKELVSGCRELIYAQYNYTPPIHFAVREGHSELVKYLLDNGAHNPDYKIYPFLEPLQILAADRGYQEIVDLLNEYATDESITLTPSYSNVVGEGILHLRRPPGFGWLCCKYYGSERLTNSYRF